MKAKKIVFTVNSVILILFLPGCEKPLSFTETTSTADSVEKPTLAANEAAATRFKESAPQGPTAVESALELSEKYAKLSEKAAALRQDNKNLLNENKQLTENLANYDAQLKQTQKELSEANDLLIDMRIELNNWKADILGFREEMRQADTEQLQALINILEILGGDMKKETNKAEEPPQATKKDTTNTDVSSTIAALDNSEQIELEE